MKFLLVIPALLLFLSNIPFIHEMDREEMAMAMKESGCCKKQDSNDLCTPPETSCGKSTGCGRASEAPSSEEDSSGDQPCNNGEERQCGMQTESTCVCVCFFHFAAPDQIGNKLHFGFNDPRQSLAGYLQENWKDPQLALPWQPPDA